MNHCGDSKCCPPTMATLVKRSHGQRSAHDSMRARNALQGGGLYVFFNCLSGLRELSVKRLVLKLIENEVAQSASDCRKLELLIFY
jgi:hypothetical protein